MDYSRQLSLAEIGTHGQTLLQKSHTVIVGVGALGCDLAASLTAAGVGKLTLIDGDCVEPSNLHRQLLYRTSDIGKNKALAAAEFLQQINPKVTIEVKTESFNRTAEWSTWFGQSGHNLVIDCSDSRGLSPELSLVNQRKTPLINGGIYRFESWFSTFDLQPNSPCPNCYEQTLSDSDRAGTSYKNTTKKGQKPEQNCSEQGVIHAATGQLALAMALEAIQCLLGSKQEKNQIIFSNYLTHQSWTINLEPNPNCPPCKLKPRIYANTTAACTYPTTADHSSHSSTKAPYLISEQQLAAMKDGDPKSIGTIDLDQQHWQQQSAEQLEDNIVHYAKKNDVKNIVLQCKHGVKSLELAAQFYWAQRNATQLEQQRSFQPTLQVFAYHQRWRATSPFIGHRQHHEFKQ